MFSYTLIACWYIGLLSAEDQKPLQPPTSYPFTPAFNKLVARSLDRWKCPGLVVAVVDGEDTFSKVGSFTTPGKLREKQVGMAGISQYHDGDCAVGVRKHP